ncbi:MULTISPECIES: hypothetical protein [Staphylococcus]|uniref:hypothetical protein n=1 Tax=Staphylococcus TaxID=1279 RepID=UPI000D025FBC|nr:MULTISPECIES: hypothetical protein [Staphylococcus]MDT0694129.1 hypothetical protein [Staphylococcus chromogenes]HDK8139675.1 hypothetical protein [Staphylococcus aureus]
MNSLEDDILAIEYIVEEIRSISRGISIYIFIDNGIKITTINKFRQKQANAFAFSNTTIKKICSIIDQQERNTSMLKGFNEVIDDFIKKRIMIYDLQTLRSLGLTYKTLIKFKKNRAEDTYHLFTLIKYAETIERWRCNSDKKMVKT